MEIIVKITTVYGREAIYPVCEKAIIFADLVKQKTLSRKQIGQIKSLGYDVVVQAFQPKL
jgi:hypothetical protein